jgi:hypothetical protein
MYRFNEEFNWDKLNIFSKKKKEELKKKEDEYDFDDEALARAIFSEIKGKVKGPINGGVGGHPFKFDYDGDEFMSFTGYLLVNGQKLKCSKETSDKFFDLFKSKQKEFRNDKEKNGEKEVKDKLKAKYNK